MNDHLWGIDLGGTKVEGAILQSSSNPDVFFRDRLPTEGHKGYDHILGQIKLVVDKMEAAVGYRPRKLGIATPGTLDPGLGLMKNSNSTNLNGKPLKTDLERILGLEVHMANDANCFAMKGKTMPDRQVGKDGSHILLNR